MSLLRLLSAGKSLVGLKDSTARYRMGHPRSMPKFGSGKNPFQSKGTNSQAAASVTPVAPAVAATPLTAAVIAEPVAPEPEPEAPSVSHALCEAPHHFEVPKPELKRAPARPAKVGGSFFSALFAPFRFLKRVRGSKAPKTSARQPVRRPVQAELSLDCVKVIRNDLSDPDLEVVRAKTPKAPAGEKVETKVPRREKVETVEPVVCGPERTREQLVEAGKS